MKKPNQKDGIVFGIEVFGWGLIVAHLYKNLAFRSVPGLTLSHSDQVFWCLWLVASILGFILTPEKKRSKFTVFATINTPIALYFLISYRQIYPLVITIIWGVILLSVVLYSLLVMMNYYKDVRAGRMKGRMDKFLKHFVHRNRMIVGVILSSVFVVLYIHLMLGGSILEPSVIPNDPRINDQKISDNIDSILLLQEDIWIDLSAQERLNVLQTVANIEATYLGLPHELNVTSENLEENTLGHYRDSIHSIAINVDLLLSGTAHELVETVAHEAYHAYEHRLVDLYDSTDVQFRYLRIFNRISTYKEEFSDYIDADEDLFGYYFQSVEFDSDAYAVAAVEDYYEEIDNYLNPEE